MSVPVLSIEDRPDIKNYFKTVVLPKDLIELKRKMIEHAAYRKELILHEFNEYKGIWDFYFVRPELVSN